MDCVRQHAFSSVEYRWYGLYLLQRAKLASASGLPWPPVETSIRGNQHPALASVVAQWSSIRDEVNHGLGLVLIRSCLSGVQEKGARDTSEPTGCGSRPSSRQRSEIWEAVEDISWQRSSNTPERRASTNNYRRVRSVASENPSCGQGSNATRPRRRSERLSLQESLLLLRPQASAIAAAEDLRHRRMDAEHLQLVLAATPNSRKQSLPPMVRKAEVLLMHLDACLAGAPTAAFEHTHHR